MVDKVLGLAGSVYDAYHEYEQSKKIADLETALEQERQAREALADYVETLAKLAESDIINELDAINADAQVMSDDVRNKLPEPINTTLMMATISLARLVLNDTAGLPSEITAIAEGGLLEKRPELLCTVVASTLEVSAVAAGAAAATQGVSQQDLDTRLGELHKKADIIADRCLTSLRRWSDLRVSGVRKQRGEPGPGGKPKYVYGYVFDGKFYPVDEVPGGVDPSRVIARTKEAIDSKREDIWPEYPYAEQTMKFAEDIDTVLPDYDEARSRRRLKAEPGALVTISVPTWKIYRSLQHKEKGPQARELVAS